MRFAFTLLAGATAVACSALTSFDGLEGNGVGGDGATTSRADGAASDDGANGSGSDGANGDGATSDDEGGGTSQVLYAEDFENNDCKDGYGEFEATLMPFAGAAHGGNKACMVCYTSGTGDFFTIDRDVPGSAPPIGAKIHAEAWVTFASGDAQSAAMFLRVHTNAPFKDIQDKEGPTLPLPSDMMWHKVTADMTVSVSGPSMDYFSGTKRTAGGTHNAGDCFAIDDVVVTMQ